jgi:hypothetical protein
MLIRQQTPSPDLHRHMVHESWKARQFKENTETVFSSD